MSLEPVLECTGNAFVHQRGFSSGMVNSSIRSNHLSVDTSSRPTSPAVLSGDRARVQRLFAKIAYYKGAMYAVKKIIKSTCPLSTEDLLELKQVCIHMPLTPCTMLDSAYHDISIVLAILAWKKA